MLKTFDDPAIKRSGHDWIEEIYLDVLTLAEKYYVRGEYPKRIVCYCKTCGAVLRTKNRKIRKTDFCRYHHQAPVWAERYRQLDERLRKR